MSAPKLGFADQVVASMCAKTYRPFDPARVVRSTFWNIAASAVLVLAARSLDGWLSIGLWALVVLRLYPYLFMGFAQRIKDEHAARLALMPPQHQEILKSSKRLARDWRPVA